MVMGRPTKYSEEYAVQAAKLCKLGATDKDLADFFAVDIATIWRWKQKHPDFCSSLKIGKQEADDQVVRSLYQRALGYAHPEEKLVTVDGQLQVIPTTKHYPPDATSAIFWLKNRQPEQWREKPEGEAGAEAIADALSKLADNLPG